MEIRYYPCEYPYVIITKPNTGIVLSSPAFLQIQKELEETSNFTWQDDNETAEKLRSIIKECGYQQILNFEIPEE